jgi:hypothetical protein
VSRRERALWLWASAVIVLSVLVEAGLPRSCAPVLIAQLWFGITLGLIGLLFWPPGGPGAPPAVNVSSEVGS